MLFSGGSSTAKPKKEEKREKRREEKDERYEIQESVFVRWAKYVCDADFLHELKDVGEIRFLSHFVQMITGGGVHLTGNKCDDIDSVFHALVSDPEDPIFQLCIPEIVEGRTKPILKMSWQLIQIYWRRFAPQGAGERKVAEALKDWCLEATASYQDREEAISITDFTDSWRDGIALNYLIHSYDDSLVDLNQIVIERREDRVDYALTIAKKHFKVPKLILPKEFTSDRLDQKSCVCYLMTLYLALVSLSTSTESSRRSKRSGSGMTASGGDHSTSSPARASPTVSVQSGTHSPAPSTSTATTVVQSSSIQLSETPSETATVIEHEPRSRKSSSSSQKSSRSRRSSRSRKNEELLKEYELCLEQVLTWLLAAEEEINLMEGVGDDADMVRRQFREHEQFMHSLTESQDSVGRVLHRGQQLCQKVEEEQSAAIDSQLVVVNERWENLRELAMQRQLTLKQQLLVLQREELERISDVLTELEKAIADNKKIEDDPDESRRQIAGHAHLQELIETQQSQIQKLSNFVVVVDDDGNAFAELEAMLQSVGQRWMTICEWAEIRAKSLDGLAQLIEQYENAYSQLSAWLREREDELTLFRSAHHLQNDEEVMEQMRLLHKMESDLESEHSSFVQLSQLCNELVLRFDATNGEAANRIRTQLDVITQMWDNIVTRLEEHSQMLIRSGKAKLGDGDRVDADRHDDPAEDPKMETENALEMAVTTSDDDSIPRALHFTSTPQSRQQDHADDVYALPPRSEPTKDPTPPPAVQSQPSPEEQTKDDTQQLVEEFLHKVRALAFTIRSLVEWVNTFKVSKRKEDVREMVRIYQRKLREIKELEPNANELTQLLERIHDATIDTKQLHIVNESFERFMRDWQWVVIKISERMNALLHKEETLDTALITRKLGDWLQSANAVLDDVMKISEKERTKRLSIIGDQLHEQQKNLVFLKQRHPSSDKDEELHRLENQLVELFRRIERYKHNPPVPPTVDEVHEHETTPKPQSIESTEFPVTIAEEAESLRQRLELEAELEEERLQQPTTSADAALDHYVRDKERQLQEGEAVPGDPTELERQLQSCDALMGELKSKDVMPAIENLLKSAEIKRNNIVDAINKTQFAIHKAVRAEEVADGHKMALDRLVMSTELDLDETGRKLSEIRDAFTRDTAYKQEAIGLLDEIASISARSQLPNREQAVATMRNRIAKLEAQWQQLGAEIDENMSCLKKEQRKCAESAVRQQTQLVDELRKALAASYEATDAEELSECLDTLERLLEQLSSADDQQPLSTAQNLQENALREDAVRLEQRRTDVVEKSRERCTKLREAISKCEHFEEALCNCQSWCNHMHHILDIRISSDIHALDVPHEYKKAFASDTLISQMDTEFREYEKLLNELDTFIAESATQGISSDRLRLQLEHARSQLNDLKAKFDEFKQPVLFIERMDRSSRRLSEVEIAIDDLTGIRAENCEYCLIHARQLTKQLEEVDAELNILEANKESLLRAGILNRDQASDVGARLSDALQKCIHLKGRGHAVVQKLERCMDMLTKLDKENDVVKRILDDLQSESAATDPTSVRDKLHQAEDSCEKARELERLLKHNSIRLNDDTVKQRDSRLETLKRQLSQWAEGPATINESSYDNVNELRDVVDELSNAIDLMEALAREDLAQALEQHRPTKEKLQAEVASLEGRTGFDDVILGAAQVLARWNSQERRLDGMREEAARHAKKNPATASLPRLDSKDIPEGAQFQQKVRDLLSEYQTAQEHLDFRRHPVESALKEFKRAEQLKLDDIVNEGRRLASQGRMELDVHEALEQLDNLVEAVRQFDADLDENEARVKTAEERQNVLDSHLTQMVERIQTLGARNFNEYSTAIVTQKDLMDARSQLGVLRRSAEELHGSLPGSSQFESTALDELNERLREIEERVQQALIKALVRDQQKAEDATSMSSGAGLSLAMEVDETEDELADPPAREPQLVGSVVVSDSQRLTPETRVDGVDPLEQFYVNLDALEEYFDMPERLPYEGIDEKLQNLTDYENELRNGEDLVNERQMTMALTEREHVLSRVESLRAKLARRRHEITQRQTEIAGLEGLFAQTEEMLANLGDQFGRSRRQRDPDGRERSPDIDELEARQLQMEDRLPPTAVHVQMCENRLQQMSDGMSTAQRERFEARLQQTAEDLAKYGSAVRDRRRHLEERLADQTHLNNHLELLEFWCDETEANISDEPSFMQLPELEHRLEQIEHRMRELPEKMDSLHALENLKDRFVALANVEPDVKHEVRRNVTQLGKRLSNLRLDLNSKQKDYQAVKSVATGFWAAIERLEKWIDEGNRQLDAVTGAKIYTPSMANVERLANEGAENIAELAELEHQMEQMATPNDYSEEAKKVSIQRVKNLSNEFDKIIDRIQNVLRDHNAVVVPDSDESERASSNQQIQGVLHGEEAISDKPSEETGTEIRTLTDTMSSRGRDQQDEKPLVRLVSGQHASMPAKERPRRMSLGEQARLDTVTRLRSWLQEVERDASITVDLVDQQIVRQLINKVQNWCDELNVNKLEMVHILDDSKDKLVRERAEYCRHDMEKVLNQCQRRKGELQRILEESRAWEQLRNAVELWLMDASERLNAGGKVKELTEGHLKSELQGVQSMVEELEPMKQKMNEINQRSNEMLEAFHRDDGHNLSHLTSKLNTLWTKFNDNVRIRKAALEASLRSRTDFDSGLAQFEEWLNKETHEVDRLHEDTNNTQRLKDTSRRKDWMALEKEARIEIDAHADVMESVRQMGYKLLENMEEGEERTKLSDRLCKVGQRWMHLTNTDRIIRERLENAQEECERLTQTLSDLIYWTEMQTTRILEDQPIGGDLEAVQKQRELVKGIEKEVEGRERLVAETIQLAHSYLMQHDLRPAMHSSSVLDPFQDEVKTDAEREERRVGVQILADSEKLKSSWELLKQHCRMWTAVVADAHRDMQELDKAIAESLLAIGAIEEELDRRRVVEELRLEELKEARVDNADLRRRCHDANVKIDDVNDWAGQIVAKNVSLTKPLDAQIHAVNQRYEKLKKSIAIRGAALERAFVDFGPSSEHFLVDSVEPPWQRAISTSNHLPYYIDHDSEKTQWDHPAMVEILEQLCSFNQVKFSAYRTAMKLRALQKRLCLDLIDLPDLIQSFQRIGDYAHEDRLKLEDMVLCLVPLFERVHQQFPHLMKNVPLAVDLVINLLLNIYDPCRDGKMRVISFKFALVVMCNANLESKYKYLFHLVSSNEGVGHKQLAVLFYDLIHVTKFLGEAAAFGGSNVEPSVRSCFEHSKYPPHLSIDGFLEWLKKEPQSLVWLPVMHRLASSEFAKHQAKCNACKMYPIVGLRYRCLRCFNYDICQSCFFSQRTSKNHKLTHPMQEYCLPTNSRDDVRDFTAMVKNKVRRARNKIGYLPVETVDEGAPLEQTSTVPQNPSSDTMHQRISLMAHRLHKRHVESQSTAPAIGPTVEGVRTVAIEGPSEAHKESKTSLQNGSVPERRNGTAADVKSPSQLISHVDQMHKEELDNLLQKLQYENVELKRAMEEKKRQAALGSLPNLEYRYRPRTHDQYQLNGAHSAGQNVYASAQTMPTRPSAAPTAPFTAVASPRAFRHHISQPALAHLNGSAMGGSLPRDRHGRSVPSLRAGGVVGTAADSEVDGHLHATDVQMLNEARGLRLHQQRLEQRSRVLEDQNRQLQMQLERLQKMVDKRSASTANIDEVNVLAQVPPETWTVPRTGAPVPPFGVDTAYGIYSTDEEDTLGGADMRRNRMQALQTTVEDLNRALESFVVSLCDSPEVADNGEV